MTLARMVMLLAPMVTMPWELALPGEPQGPISELRMVTLDDVGEHHAGAGGVVTCTFSIT